MQINDKRFVCLDCRTDENFAKRACKFLAEVIVYERLQRFG